MSSGKDAFCEPTVIRKKQKHTKTSTIWRWTHNFQIQIELATIAMMKTAAHPLWGENYDGSSVQPGFLCVSWLTPKPQLEITIAATIVINFLWEVGFSASGIPRICVRINKQTNKKKEHFSDHVTLLLQKQKRLLWVQLTHKWWRLNV